MRVLTTFSNHRSLQPGSLMTASVVMVTIVSFLAMTFLHDREELTKVNSLKVDAITSTDVPASEPLTPGGQITRRRLPIHAGLLSRETRLPADWIDILTELSVSETASEDDSCYARLCVEWARNRAQPQNVDRLLASTDASTVALATLSIPSVAPTTLMKIGTIEKRIEAARTQLQVAETKSTTTQDPADQLVTTKQRIRLMSWVMLLGEILSHETHSTELRFPVRRANALFDEGFELLDKIEIESASPEFYERLASDQEGPGILTLLDAVRLRKSKSLSRFARSIQATRQHALVLVDVAAAYRDLAHTVLRLAQMQQQDRPDHVLQLLDDLNGQTTRFKSIFETPTNEWLFDERSPADWATALNQLDGPLHVVRGFTLHRAGTRSSDPDQQKDILDEALAEAQEGIKHEDSRPASQIVAAITHEALGDLYSTKLVNADNRLLAQKHFEHARSLLKSAGNLDEVTSVGETHGTAVDRLATASNELPADWLSLVTLAPNNVGAAVKLPADLELRYQELTSTASFHRRADELEAKRQVDAAYQLLKKGANRHFNRKVWRRLIETGLRSNVDHDELTNLVAIAGEERIFGAADFTLDMLKGRLLLRSVLAELSSSADDDGAKTPGGADEPLRQLETARQHLLSAMELADESRDRAQVAGWLTLISATRLNADGSDTFSTAAVESARGYAAVATSTLEPLWRTASADVADREALAAALLGQGFLSLRLSDEHEARRLATLSFAAAIDVQASLPFEDSAFAQLGTPLIQALRSGGGNPLTEQLANERTRGRTLTLLATGVLALHLNSPELAIQRITEGLQTLDPRRPSATVQQKLPKSADALTLFTREAASGVSQVLHTLSTYRLLAEAEQIRAIRESQDPVSTLRTALTVGASVDLQDDSLHQLLDSPGDEEQFSDRLSGLLRGQSDPVRQLALLRSVEEHIASLPAHSPTRSLLRSTVAAWQETSSSTIQDATLLPVQQQIENTQRRILNPDEFSSHAAKLASEMQWGQSSTVLNEGLFLHPENTVLWKQRIELQLRIADRQHGDEELLATASELLAVWNEVSEDSPTRDWLAARIDLQRGAFASASTRLTELLSQSTANEPVSVAEILAALAATRSRSFARDQRGVPTFSESAELTAAIPSTTKQTGKQP